MRILLLIFAFFSLNSYSQDKFQVGSGSEFELAFKDNGKVQLSIYLTESSFNRLGVEYYFSTTNSFIPIKMWQQFILGMRPGKPMAISEGYVKTMEMKTSEQMTEDFFYQNRGVQVSDFLFVKKEELEKDKVGVGTVEVPAGSVLATHYRKKRNGQVIDFWIADEVKPIGLVKLISVDSKNAANNYTLKLTSLVRNVKASIDPKKSIPLTEKGKSLLKRQ